MSDNTYYMEGSRIVHVHEMVTSIKEDYQFLMSGPETNIIGMNYKKQRWMLDREAYIREYHKYMTTLPDENGSRPFAFDSMRIVTDDHPLVKVILMHELIGAV